MSIRTKIFLFFITPIFLVYLAISVFNAIENFVELRKLSEDNFLSVTESAARKISRDNATGLALSKSAASAAELMFGSRPENVKLVRTLLEAFPEYVGASVGYETNADFNDSAVSLGLQNLKDGRELSANGGMDSYDFKNNRTRVFIDEWIAKSTGGRFVAYWTRDKGELFLEPLVDMDTSMYSAGLKKKIEAGEGDASILTEPYLYNNKILMIEYASAIFNRGRFAGQVAFDRDLGGIENDMDSVKTYPDSEIFLLSAQAKVIATTKNPNLRTVSINDLIVDDDGNFVSGNLSDDSSSVSKIAASAASNYHTFYKDVLNFAFESSKSAIVLGNNAGKVSYFKDTENGYEYCVAFSLVRPGNWVLVQIVPRSQIYSIIYSSLFRECAGVAVFAATILFVMFFAGRAFRRLDASIDTVSGLADGNLNVEISDAADFASDESGRLQKAVSELVSRVVKYSSAISENNGRLSANVSSANEMAVEYSQNLAALESSLREASQTCRILSLSNAEASAEDARDMSVEMANMLDSGRERLAGLLNSVTEISKSASAMGRRLSSIGANADSMASTVAAMSKLADETGILALNASVEAEKAGEAGLRFAALAREIGGLSERASRGAREIENFADDIRAAAHSGEIDGERIFSRIDSGGEKISSVISAAETISGKMGILRVQCDKLIEELHSRHSGSIKTVSALEKGESDVRALLENISNIAESIKVVADFSKRIGDAVGEFRGGEK